MRAATVIGIILIGLGAMSFAYAMFPIGLLIQTGSLQQRMNLVPAVAGAIALISGIALLVAVQLKVNKNKSKS